jgi:hypothetical protein
VLKSIPQVHPLLIPLWLQSFRRWQQNFFDLREKTGIGLSNLQILVHKRVPRIYIEDGKEIYCEDGLLENY